LAERRRVRRNVMATMLRPVLPLLFNHQARAVVAVLTALAAGLLLGAGDAAALPRVHWGRVSVGTRSLRDDSDLERPRYRTMTRMPAMTRKLQEAPMTTVVSTGVRSRRTVKLLGGGAVTAVVAGFGRLEVVEAKIYGTR
jgi:hypothetical protein